MTNPLMSRDEVAALLGIKPNSVRDTLRRYGITEQRGYPREAVENLKRPGRGYRTDLERQHDFSAATRVRNTATGTVYVRVPGTNKWTDTEWAGRPVTTRQLEALVEMVAEDE